MNNSINYGNFIALLLKNNDDGNFEHSIHLDKCISKRNKPILGKKKKLQDIDTLEK